MSLLSRDKALVWHPFTQEKIAPERLAIASGRGSYLLDEHGRQYLDLISSWWVNLHGHAHPAIVAAIAEQASRLEHVLFAGFTHQPAVALCERLSSILPASLVRFFFSDNGSTCVEVALKMALQYWFNQEQRVRPYFLSFAGGYHGDTFGAMSVGAQSGYFDPFKPLCFKVLTIPFPDTYLGDTELVAKEQAALEVLEAHLAANAHEISALIIEPLIQGASGMRMCRPEFINAVVAIVRAAGILVIYDEVMTGFGRTGTYFALDQLAHAPDLLCLSKGITGGFLPLALTVTTEAIYQAFLSDSLQHAFLHGHSYTANPIACAAAVASFDLLVQTDTQTAIQALAQAHQQGLALLQQRCPTIRRLRTRGTIAAFDVQVSIDLKLAFLQAQLILRPIGHTVYILPPYSVTPTELLAAYDTVAAILVEHAQPSNQHVTLPQLP
jgi:adenosylmethionine-8-amino-7-oxononanoate aminotransferase